MPRETEHPAVMMQRLLGEKHDLILENEQLKADLKRLWHFAGCPFDHCEKCIADAEWIKSLHKRLGPPSAKSVQAQHDER